MDTDTRPNRLLSRSSPLRPPRELPSRLFGADEEEDEAIAVPAQQDLPPRPLDRSSWDYIVKTGVAGGLAGCVAKTVVAPLDRVKILFQASNPQFAKYSGHPLGVVRAIRDIGQSDGLRGLFRGHSATLLRVFPYAGIKFLAYEQIRAAVIPSKEYETPARRFISGSLAGLTSVFSTYPLEVVRVRLAFETKKDSRSSLSQICKQIYHEQPPQTHADAAVARVAPRSGLVNFYRGFSSTLLGMVPYAGMSFVTHDTVGDLFRHPSLAQYTVLPSTAVDPAHTAEPGKTSHKQQLTAPAQLIAGAIAGAVSQTASYPLEIIRRRMQVGGAVGDGHRLGIAETARRIFMERGWRGFFVGLTIGYIKVIPMVATSFYAYERGKWALGIG
ncbi:hypothetical protein DV737_g664, partial [Chaetothyriales sp. CBS 132003]